MGQVESNDEQGHVINSSTTDESYVALPKSNDGRANEFQAELKRRREIATEQYKRDLEIYLVQQAVKYDTDEYVEKCVTELKEAALQFASENKERFSFLFPRFACDAKFASEPRAEQLEQKIMARIADKFCIDTGIPNAMEEPVFRRGFKYSFENNSIHCRCIF